MSQDDSNRHREDGRSSCTRKTQPPTEGAPRVSPPLGLPSSLGVESSHDELTPPPFVCGVESYCHDSTLPPLPLGVKSSWDDSTPPPSPWRVESSGDNLTPPPPLRGGPSRGFPPLQRPRGPPPPIPLRGDRGPLRRPRGPQSFPPLPRVLPLPIPGGLPFFPLAHSKPHGGPASPPVVRCGGAFPVVAPTSPRIPL